MPTSSSGDSSPLSAAPDSPESKKKATRELPIEENEPGPSGSRSTTKFSKKKSVPKVENQEVRRGPRRSSPRKSIVEAKESPAIVPPPAPAETTKAPIKLKLKLNAKTAGHGSEQEPSVESSSTTPSESVKRGKKSKETERSTVEAQAEAAEVVAVIPRGKGKKRKSVELGVVEEPIRHKRDVDAPQKSGAFKQGIKAKKSKVDKVEPVVEEKEVSTSKASVKPGGRGRARKIIESDDEDEDAQNVNLHTSINVLPVINKVEERLDKDETMEVDEEVEQGNMPSNARSSGPDKRMLKGRKHKFDKDKPRDRPSSSNVNPTSDGAEATHHVSQNDLPPAKSPDKNNTIELGTSDLELPSQSTPKDTTKSPRHLPKISKTTSKGTLNKPKAPRPSNSTSPVPPSRPAEVTSTSDATDKKPTTSQPAGSAPVKKPMKKPIPSGIKPTPTGPPGMGSLLSNTLAALQGGGSTPKREPNTKKETKPPPKKLAGGWTEEWTLSVQQLKEFAASKADREAEKAKRRAYRKNPVNLQEAKDAYRLDSTMRRVIPDIPGSLGIKTTGMPSKMVEALWKQWDTEGMLEKQFQEDTPSAIDSGKNGEDVVEEKMEIDVNVI